MGRVAAGILGIGSWLSAGGLPHGCEHHGGGGGSAGAAGTVAQAGSTSGDSGADAGGSTGAAGAAGVAGSAGPGGTTGAGGTAAGGASDAGGAGGASSTCAADEYQEVGVSGCRQCTNWRYSELDTSCRVIGTNNSYDPVTHELVIEPGDGMPLPLSWSGSSAGLIDGDFEPLACTASAQFSVRNGKLVADLSQFQACADASGGPTTFELDNISADYGCAGKGFGGLSIQFNMTGEDFGFFTDCFDDPNWPRKRLIPGSPERPFPGAAGPNTCSDSEYREVGFPGCRECGPWQYGPAQNGEFPSSCRVIGSHHHFDASAHEVVIEPGLDLPVPTSWSGDFVSLHNLDPQVVLPPCAAQVAYRVRDGLLIADVSAFQSCSLPPGTSLDFGMDLVVDYGCAGSSISSTLFTVDLTSDTSTVGTECLSEDDWPLKASSSGP